MSHEREFTTIRTARRLQNCTSCGYVIWSNERYREVKSPPGHTYLSNEKWATFRECCGCAEARGCPLPEAVNA